MNVHKMSAQASYYEYLYKYIIHIYLYIKTNCIIYNVY
jgi:hypothetical protein